MYYYPSVLNYTVQLPFFPFFGRSGGEFLNIFFSLKKSFCMWKKQAGNEKPKKLLLRVFKKNPDIIDSEGGTDFI